MNFEHPMLLEIAQGEGKKLELKRELPQGVQLAQTLIAFANTAGGKLIIGINDQRELVGLGSADVFELKDSIASVTHDSCRPDLLPDIYVENVQGVELLVIEVSRGTMLPYYLKSKGRNLGTFIRLGATNRLASMQYIQELVRQRMNMTFDEQAYLNTNITDIDYSSLINRFEQQGKLLTPEKMRNLKLIVQENGQDHPSFGLMILLGLLEHVETKCSRFKGTDMSVFLDKKEFTGDLFSQLEQAETFIKTHLPLKVQILGLQRSENYEIPMSAIR